MSKILFVSCYVNNTHWMNLTKKTLDKCLIDCSYSFICLNDAPDISSGERNYLKICDSITGLEDCYDKIVINAKKNDFIHIKIPQEIHVENRPNQGGPRHIENLNWFNQNIDILFPSYKSYDYICHIDSDAFLMKPIHLMKELAECDLAGPFIYLNASQYYIHTGLFFINVKTVLNMKDIRWDDTMGTDTGSDITNFIHRNPQYKIKKLGHYAGYSVNNHIPNGHTIIPLDMPNDIDICMRLVDSWFDKHFIHFRAGSCFGVGSNRHRNHDQLHTFNLKYEAFMKIIEYSFKA